MKIAVALLFLLASTSALSADDVDVDYTRDVKSICRERCYACHGALKQEAGLRLDTGSLAKTGGDNGAVIVPSDVEHSPLLERISAIDENVRMPPEGKPLTADQIRILTRWIQSGAVSPEAGPGGGSGQTFHGSSGDSTCSAAIPDRKISAPSS